MRLIWGSRRVFGTAVPRSQPYDGGAWIASLLILVWSEIRRAI
jgi:hypothetical protein